MTADIVPISTARTGNPSPTRNIRTYRRAYTIADMAVLIGCEGFTTRTAIEWLRDFAAQRGMPLPRNSRRFKGKLVNGPNAIGARSVWDASEVDSWLARPTPTTPAEAALPPSPPSHLRDRLRDRAQMLRAAS